MSGEDFARKTYWEAWRALPRLHRALVQAQMRDLLAEVAEKLEIPVCEARRAAHQGTLAITFLMCGGVRQAAPARRAGPV